MLLTYENEALFAERNGEDVEHVTPDDTFKIENPVAVAQHDQAQGAGEGVRRLPLHARGPGGVGRGRLPPGRPDRRAGVRRRLPGARRSCGRSTTSAAGARSTTSSSSPDKGSVAKIYDEATS